MLIISQSFEDGTYLVANGSSFKKIGEVAKKYNLSNQQVQNLLKEFGIGFKADPVLDKIGDLLDNGDRFEEICKTMKMDRSNLKYYLRKSYELNLTNQRITNEQYIKDRYGEKVYNAVLNIKDRFGIHTYGDLPLELFRNYSFYQLLDMGIKEKTIITKFKAIGRDNDVQLYYNDRKAQKQEVKTLKAIYEDPEKRKIIDKIKAEYEGNVKITLRQLSNKYGVNYPYLGTVKRRENWVKGSAVPNEVIKDARQRLKYRAIKFYDDGHTIYTISQLLDAKPIEVGLLIKEAMEERDENEKFNINRHIGELFIEAHVPVPALSTIFEITNIEVRKRLKKYLGTIPDDMVRYDANYDIRTWSQFQIEFLESDLSDEELSAFISKPVEAIKAKRLDLHEHRIEYHLAKGCKQISNEYMKKSTYIRNKLIVEENYIP